MSLHKEEIITTVLLELEDIDRKLFMLYHKCHKEGIAINDEFNKHVKALKEGVDGMKHIIKTDNVYHREPTK